LVDEDALDALVVTAEAIPSRLDDRTMTGEPMPNFLAALRRSRSAH